ncbi:unnamed protein product [Linum trigynum]|uniref:Uncharacterized protein n=1 Tax=Linum trigynum TaxID=586398 RepID=A0AAV2DBU0_9ROSI
MISPSSCSLGVVDLPYFSSVHRREEETRRSVEMARVRLRAVMERQIWEGRRGRARRDDTDDELGGTIASSNFFLDGCHDVVGDPARRSRQQTRSGFRRLVSAGGGFLGWQWVAAAIL